MDSVTDDRFLFCRVSPFGNLRIDAYVPLPGAYRSLSRPSSAPDAKAFPLRSFSLNLLVLKNYAGSIRFSVCRNCYPLFSTICFKLLPSVALLVLCSLFSFQCAGLVVADLAGFASAVTVKAVKARKRSIAPPLQIETSVSI